MGCLEFTITLPDVLIGFGTTEKLKGCMTVSANPEEVHGKFPRQYTIPLVFETHASLLLQFIEMPLRPETPAGKAYIMIKHHLV